MLLAIDVGNTNIVLAVFERRELIRSWRLQTQRERTSDDADLPVRAGSPVMPSTSSMSWKARPSS